MKQKQLTKMSTKRHQHFWRGTIHRDFKSKLLQPL